jgi:ABC-type multidrug transport system ATPase subunit
VSDDFERLTVTTLSRHYGRRKALSKVTFTCHAGDIIGLLGPNGAGKSTLLAVLGTLLTPSEGRVEYGMLSADVGGAALRARIGMLGHDLFLYPELTALENLTFFGRLYGVPDAANRARRALGCTSP